MKKFLTGSIDRPFLALCALLTAAAFVGGSSRSDILLAVLVPLIAIGATFICMLDGKIVRSPDRLPLAFVLAFLALGLLQLAPLPPGLWTLLPGREGLVRVDVLLGEPGIWRPLSLLPDGTLRFCLGLIVPIGIVACMSNMDVRHQRALARVLLGFTAASVVLVILQLASGTAGQFQLYTMVTPGEANGLFANRNHQGIFFAAMLPLAALEVQHAARRRISNALQVGLGATLLAVAALLILVGGSRIGLICGAIGLCGAIAVQWRPRAERATGMSNALLKILALGAVIAAAFLLLASAGRLETINRMVAGDVSEDTRFAIYPTLTAMLKTFFPFGSGFGSFESVYQQFERFELLGPHFLNAAHNDFIQLGIEGGLGAAVLIGSYVFFFVRATWVCWRRPATSTVLRARAASVAIAVILVGSIFDYPARTALILCVGTISSMWLWAGWRFLQSPNAPSGVYEDASAG